MSYTRKADVLPELVNALDFENALEKFWTYSSDLWWPDEAIDKVRIRALGDVVIDGVVTLNDQFIKCPLCGRDDNWDVEGDSRKHIVKVFVCEHNRKQLEELGLVFWLPCRVVSTVPADLVLEYEKVC